MKQFDKIEKFYDSLKNIETRNSDLADKRELLKNKVKKDMKIIYKNDISFQKDKVSVKSINETNLKEIYNLNQEIDDLKKALKELEVTKNETL